jgi:hypothetical protein
MSYRLSHLILVTASVLVIIVATQSFQTASYVSGEKQAGSWIRIPKDQAINAIKESGKSDPKKDIIRDEALKSI